MIQRCTRCILLAGLLAAPSFAGSAEKTVAFKIGEWIDLTSTDGPVTLHRIRLVREGGFTKSSFMRPGNSQYLDDVQIQLEYTNDSTNDWKAKFDIEWLDADGNTIDGYKGEEGLDSEQRHEDQTVTVSTLKYGLEKARKLKIRIDTNPD
ncbi:MAG: hypothetical protein ABIV06_13535 [Thermoanaerobaculia bacterium]